MEFHEVANIFPLMQGREFDELKADIKNNGLLEFIYTHQGKIIDGRNRYLACQQIGLQPKFKVWNGEGSLTAFVVSLNLHRRHLTESQRAMIGARIKPMFEAEAKERQGTRTDISANLRSGEFQKSSDEAAHTVNVSPRSVESASKVIKQGTPELTQKVDEGKIKVSTAAVIAEAPKEEQKVIVQLSEKEILEKAREIRQQKREERNQKEAEAKKSLAKQSIPVTKYQTIVIDPPWPMQKIIRDCRPNQAEFDYPTMTIEEIKAFPINKIAHDNCHLYLWTTHKFLPAALEITKHWGFNYECLMTWVKNVGFTPFSWMYSTEHVLFCRRGSLEVMRKGLRLDFQAKVREHSRKPEEFYQLVIQASPGPRIDVFSREKRVDFDQYGNEAEKFEKFQNRQAMV